MASIISLCDICNLRFVYNPSTHWCQDCDEALCNECKEHHTLSKATRTHTTISMADYQKLPAFITDIKPYCKLHNEKYQNYCKRHECPICYKCIQDHVKCIDIIPLEMVIQEPKTSQIFHDLDQSISDVHTNIMRMRKCRENNMTEITDQCKSAVRKIRDFRKTFNNHLDCIEQNLMTSLHDIEIKYCKKDTRNP
ncbi:unnamed protein product [Mytilus coruscus]|uniref:B box-type domain-containing protein n=1 Tax=Mytilus coruscus TaxID=42192 RepID=A0A6J8EBB7_MYTCO|nr:unnamed protein product [Mytilus coruscus]